MKKLKINKKLVGKWIVPITKEFDSVQEAKDLLPFTCNVRLAYMKSKRYVIVRQLTESDILSIDFMKYVLGFKFKDIKKVAKI